MAARPDVCSTTVALRLLLYDCCGTTVAVRLLRVLLLRVLHCWSAFKRIKRINSPISMLASRSLNTSCAWLLRKGIVTLDHNGELPAPSQNYSQQEVPLHRHVDNLSLAEKFGPRMNNSAPPPESLIMHPSAKQDGGLKVIIKGKPELSPVHRYSFGTLRCIRPKRSTPDKASSPPQGRLQALLA
jgi:hypothetical protein